MKTVALRCAFALCFCASLLSLEGCDMEGEKVVTYEPITRESLTPEELKSLEKMEQMQKGAPTQLIGEQALEAARAAQEKRETEKANGGGDAKQ